MVCVGGDDDHTKAIEKLVYICVTVRWFSWVVGKVEASSNPHFPTAQTLFETWLAGDAPSLSLQNSNRMSCHSNTTVCFEYSSFIIIRVCLHWIK